MTGRAIAFVAGLRQAGAAAEAPAGLGRAQAGAVDVLYLPPGVPATPRDRLRAVLAAHRTLDALIPLPPRADVSLEDGLAVAERAAGRLLQRLRAVAETCEVEVVWEARPHPGPARGRLPAGGAAWLQARAAALANAERLCAALRARAEEAGASALQCRAEQGRARARLATPRSGLETLWASLGAAAQDPALSGGSLLVTGPWPAFTLACDAVAGTS